MLISVSTPLLSISIYYGINNDGLFRIGEKATKHIVKRRAGESEIIMATRVDPTKPFVVGGTVFEPSQIKPGQVFGADGKLIGAFHDAVGSQLTFVPAEKYLSLIDALSKSNGSVQVV